MACRAKEIIKPAMACLLPNPARPDPRWRAYSQTPLGQTRDGVRGKKKPVLG